MSSQETNRHDQAIDLHERRIVINVFGQTVAGKTRKNNEDSFAISDLAKSMPIHSTMLPVTLPISDRGILIAVSDGMGGAQAGEIASSLVLRALHHGLSTITESSADVALRVTIEDVNRQVVDTAHLTDRGGMGATLTAILFSGDYAYIAEIGDSRAYLLRADHLVQITHDQSLVQQLIDSGLISKEESGTSQFKHIILQAMGVNSDIAVALNRLAVRRNDRFLICSDGLTGEVKDSEILEVILDSTTLASACARLVETAVDHGSKDDITVIMAEVSGAGSPILTVAEHQSFETLKIVN